MAGAAPKILVVDDYAYNRLIYREWLAGLPGVEIHETSSGQRALQLAREHDFAMFLLDVNVPDMDGFELASLLRLEPRAQSTPIVFVTSEATARNDLVRGYRMGAADFMTSATVHGEILLQKARVFVQLFRDRQELSARAERMQEENGLLHEQLEQSRREREALQAQATLDTLTRLPNRALFRDRLCSALARAARHRQRFAVACVDLDGFGEINDRHGRAIGDALIAAMAERMTVSLRASDTVARLGGDAFALLFEGLDSLQGAEYVSHKLHRTLAAPMTLLPPAGGAEVQLEVGASIGVAVYPDHAREPDELVTLADLTLYATKRSGGGARLYTDGLVPRRTDSPAVQLVRSRG